MKNYKASKRCWCLLPVLVNMLLGAAFFNPQYSGAATDKQLVDLGNGTIQETITGRMWQVKRSRLFRNLDEARQYAADLELGGYTDWRLPTIYELYDLYYLFDLKKNGDVKIKLDGNYWAGEKDGEGMAGSWEIGDQCEPARQYFKKKKGYVRAVRP